jgi:hypothetical protein
MSQHAFRTRFAPWNGGTASALLFDAVRLRRRPHSNPHDRAPARAAHFSLDGLRFFSSSASVIIIIVGSTGHS